MQDIYCRPFEADVHITPRADFGKSVDIVIGNVHTTGVSYPAVDNDNFPVIPVGGVIDVWEFERIEFYYFDASFTDSLEMAFF